MADFSLSVGDRVVYPNQGVCLVTGVDTKDIAGQKLTLFNLRREEDGAVVMVPQSKVTSIGIRKVSSPSDVEKVFAFLKSDSDKATLDWKQRARTNVDRMATGGLIGLAEVVKGLQVLSELRPLPTKERELYDNARHLLVAEMAVALGVNEVAAEDAIDVILFPPGKERPKRTAEEFRAVAGGEDDLPIDDDFGGLEDEPLEAPEEEEAPPEEEEVEEKPQKAAKAKGKKAEKATKGSAPKAKVAKAVEKKPAAKKAAKPKAKPAAKAKPDTKKKKK